MAKSLITKIIFSGVDQTSRVLSGIQRNVSGAANAMNQAGRGLRSGGFATAAAITAPFAAFGKSAIDSTVQFEDAANAYEAVNQSVTDLSKAMAFAREESYKLGASTIFQPTQIMEAQRALAMMGLSGEVVQGIDGNPTTAVASILDDATNLAAAGRIGIEDAADKLTNATLAYFGKIGEAEMNTPEGIEKFNQQVGEMSNIIAATATSSNTDVAKILFAMKEAAPIARVMGTSLDELGARLGNMADNGFKGAEAGRAIRTGMLRLIAPTAAVRAALQQYNVDLSDFITFNKQALNADGLVSRLSGKGLMDKVSMNRGQIEDLFNLGLSDGELMEQLNTQLTAGMSATDTKNTTSAIESFFISSVQSADLKKLTKAIKDRFGDNVPAGFWADVFGKRQVAKFFAEVGDPGALDELQDRINLKLSGKGAGEFAADMAETLMQGIPGAVKRLSAAFDTFQIRLTTAIQGELVLAMDTIRNGLNSFIENTSVATKRALVFGGVIASIAGPMLIYFGLAAQGVAALLKVFSVIAAPITIAVRALNLFAVAALGAAAASKLAVLSLLKMSAVGALIAGAGYVIYNAMDKIKGAFDGRITSAMSDLSSAVKTFFQDRPELSKLYIAAALGKLKVVASDVGKAIKSSFTETLDAIENRVPQFGSVRSAFSRFGESVTSLFANISSIDLSGLGGGLGDLGEKLTSIAMSGAAFVVNSIATGIGVLSDAVARFNSVFPEEGFMAGLDEAFAPIDDILPNFERFRDGIASVATSIGNVWNELVSVFSGSLGSDTDMSALKELTAFLADSYLSAGAAVLRAVAWGLNSVAAGIRELRESFSGGALTGIKEFFTDPSWNKLFAVAAGLAIFKSAILSVGKAMYVFSGARFIIGLIKGIGAAALRSVSSLNKLATALKLPPLKLPSLTSGLQSITNSIKSAISKGLSAIKPTSIASGAKMIGKGLLAGIIYELGKLPIEALTDSISKAFGVSEEDRQAGKDSMNMPFMEKMKLIKDEWGKNFQYMSDVISDFSESTPKKLSDLGSKISETDLGQAFLHGNEDFKKKFAEFKDHIRSTVEDIQSKWESLDLTSVFSTALGWIKTEIESLANTLLVPINKVRNALGMDKIVVGTDEGTVASNDNTPNAPMPKVSVPVVDLQNPFPKDMFPTYKESTEDMKMASAFAPSQAANDNDVGFLDSTLSKISKFFSDNVKIGKPTLDGAFNGDLVGGLKNVDGALGNSAFNGDVVGDIRRLADMLGPGESQVATETPQNDNKQETIAELRSQTTAAGQTAMSMDQVRNEMMSQRATLDAINANTARTADGVAGIPTAIRSGMAWNRNFAGASTAPGSPASANISSAGMSEPTP